MNSKTLLLLTAAVAVALTLSTVHLLNNSSLRNNDPSFPDIPCLSFQIKDANIWTSPYPEVLETTNNCDISYTVSYFDGYKDESSGCISNNGKPHKTPIYNEIHDLTVVPC